MGEGLMTEFKLYDRVVIKETGRVGMVVDNGRTGHCYVVSSRPVGKELFRNDELQLYVDKPEPWSPANGEDYYYISGVFELHKDNSDDRFHCNIIRIETGNYYKTKEQAERVANCLKFESQVRSMFRDLNGGEVGFLPDGLSYTLNVLFHLDSDCNSLVEVDWCVNCRNSPTGWWADSREKVEKVIEHFGKEKFIAWAKGEL
jgi:hypothetical protein